MAAWRRRADQPVVQVGGFAALMVATAALVYHLTRGTSFLFDDWSFVLGRRGGSLATYLDPHNQHFSLVVVAIYKFLFATFGIGSYAPYRIVMIVCSLSLCGLLYTYARTRVGAWPALAVTAVLALLGPGWEDILWPFQIGFVLPLCAAIGALLALDRRTRRADLLACGLSAAALASSGVGIPVAVGIAADICVDIARRRRPLSDLWIVALPFAMFAAWWAGYQQGGSFVGDLGQAPSFIEKEAASAVASLFGRAGSIGLDGPGTLTTWGTPLLIAVAALVLWRVLRGGPVRAGVIAPATMLIVFWLATAATRTVILGNPYASRYIYVSATFLLLVGVELAGGWRPAPIVAAALAVIAVIAVASNIGELRSAGALVRAFGQATSADLGALEVARPLERAGYIAHELPGYPLIEVPAHEFLEITRTLGNPAAGVKAIESDNEPVREIVDRELITIQGIAPMPVSAGHVTVTRCRRLPSRSAAAFEVTRSDRGLLIRAGAEPVRVSVRRFAVLFQPIETVAAGRSAEVRIAPDLSAVPWQVQLSSASPATACALG